MIIIPSLYATKGIPCSPILQGANSEISHEEANTPSQMHCPSAKSEVDVKFELESPLLQKVTKTTLTQGAEKDISTPERRFIRMSAKAKAINRRNIYKSLVRIIRASAKKHRIRLTEELLKAGYSIINIREAFITVEEYKSVEKGSKNKKKYQRLIKGIIAEGSILAHILRDALKEKMNSWEGGEQGRIAVQNFMQYKKIYTRCLNLLSKQPSRTLSTTTPNKLVQPKTL